MKSFRFRYGMAITMAISVLHMTSLAQVTVYTGSDGPFIQYVDDQMAYLTAGRSQNGEWIVGMEFFPLNGRNEKQLEVTFPNNPAWNFTFGLQPTLTVQPDQYPQPDKLLVLSDIEGEFSLFRNMLLTNKVIDENSGWSFGNGHVVILGDMVDRGTDVMACLWLIYKLEQEAAACGGQIHYILGNHEIMNLSGDFRYVDSKYMDVATAMGMQYADFFGPDSEIGRWLCTKHIMERIGNILFVHGGISMAVANCPYDLKEINDLCRPFYTKAQEWALLSQKGLAPFFESASSPFWYRGYFKADPVTEQDNVSKALDKFEVTAIVVGHTVVETIQFGLQGKVLAIDVDHHAGNGEVALLEKGKWYKVDGQGVKTELYVTL